MPASSPRCARRAEQISGASAEIARGNHDLRSRTEHATSSLEQTSHSVTELGEAIASSAESAASATELAGNAAHIAERGGKAMAEVVSTMNDINTSSQQIADIVGVIDGIAFQTNILALNAAVEAARAGEQGRGFAVVAGEVGSLAKRSADAAMEIKGLIGNSVTRVEAGSRLVAGAGGTMDEIVESVRRMSETMQTIGAAAETQRGRIGTLDTAIGGLGRMTAENDALVKASALAAESLDEQTRRLTGVVGTFRLCGDTAPTRAAAGAAT